MSALNHVVIACAGCGTVLLEADTRATVVDNGNALCGAAECRANWRPRTPGAGLIIRLDKATGKRSTITRAHALVLLCDRPWHDPDAMAIVLDHADEALAVQSDAASFWPAVPVIRCADTFCPWCVDPGHPDAQALVAQHAMEHEGGRQSNVQAARAAKMSRELRHAGRR